MSGSVRGEWRPVVLHTQRPPRQTLHSVCSPHNHLSRIVITFMHLCMWYSVLRPQLTAPAALSRATLTLSTVAAVAPFRALGHGYG